MSTGPNQTRCFQITPYKYKSYHIVIILLSAICHNDCVIFLQKASSDDFVDHECGQYPAIKSNPDAVIELLRKAGSDYYKKREM